MPGRQDRSPGLFDGDEGMTRRNSVDKQKAAKSFRGEVNRTKKINMAPRPMRGGIRL